MTAALTTQPDVRRRRAYVAIACCVAAIVAIIVLGVVLSENVVYFHPVSEALRSRESDGTRQIRIAGAVVPGSVHQTAGGVRFKIADNEASAEILHHGDVPQLFRAKLPVVCEGHWRHDGTFSSDRILIRHGNNYSPPKVDTDKAQ